MFNQGGESIAYNSNISQDGGYADHNKASERKYFLFVKLIALLLMLLMLLPFCLMCCW